MEKQPVRCLRLMAAAGRRDNILILFPVCDFGYGHQLYQCLSCQELFAASVEDPALQNVPDGDVPRELVHGVNCVTCGSALVETLVAYPRTFVAPGGGTGHFVLNDSLPSADDSNSGVYDFWLLSR